MPRCECVRSCVDALDCEEYARICAGSAENSGAILELFPGTILDLAQRQGFDSVWKQMILSLWRNISTEF